MLEDKHWNRGAIKCLDILMKGMSGYFDGRNGRLLMTLEDLR